MRTIVDIPENQIKALDVLGKKHDLSRAELVRRAVTQYLEGENKAAKNDLDKYFGLFKNDPTVFDGMDGRAWQKKIRDEWADRDTAADSRLAENAGLNDHKQADFESQ